MTQHKFYILKAKANEETLTDYSYGTNVKNAHETYLNQYPSCGGTEKWDYKDAVEPKDIPFNNPSSINSSNPLNGLLSIKLCELLNTECSNIISLIKNKEDFTIKTKLDSQQIHFVCIYFYLEHEIILLFNNHDSSIIFKYKESKEYLDSL